TNSDLSFEVLSRDDAVFRIQFNQTDIMDDLESIGRMPLPPYIKRQSENVDLSRYQTVFARQSGAVAAPTAGLHFTDEIIQCIKDKGISIAELTLHVGAGTFKPVAVENLADHPMHFERYILDTETAELINQTKTAGGNIVAVGTTSVRTLESCATETGQVAPGSGKTNLFIYPPYQMKVIDKLLTNFHLPKSTLLMLVSAMAGSELIRDAYAQAIQEKYRFYSYGDCMFIE
ncbi:MAG: tRNA preQ1(34) S-adenosylmethionine ribosyltransferase-isomerase QueA, partial [Lentisphaeria bacterium]|nr:tRNA preQ1(34) S-adenosylmethionine ribosyltransferase-isomerase QueA [Lentisphaeria bacterium]